MRGKGVTDILRAWDARITPAHAGKRARALVAQMMGRDHPRPCGEKI